MPKVKEGVNAELPLPVRAKTKRLVPGAVRGESGAMPAPCQSHEQLVQRFHALRDVLAAHARLWRPAPFHEFRPAWCETHRDFAVYLLGLDDDRVEALAADNLALIDLVGRFVPALLDLHGLIELPRRDVCLVADNVHHCRHVPGRKQDQIEAFAGAVGTVAAPLLEWCAGKGHLGRLLGGHWRQTVLSLELDETLCGEGKRLAAKAGVEQDFRMADVLAAESGAHLAGRHAVALHACGDLHLALLRGAAERGAPAVDLAPCCYYRTSAKEYVPLNPDAGLRLSRDELHLAVSETATAGARDRRQRDRAMAWKLAFVEFRAERGIPRERTFKPVPAGWYSAGFATWMERLARREGVDPPAQPDWPAWEERGWARQREVMRLNLARLVFRRPLEIWLALDRALFLARHGYRVGLAEFCDRALTPRNLLISARLDPEAG